MRDIFLLLVLGLVFAKCSTKPILPGLLEYNLGKYEESRSKVDAHLRRQPNDAAGYELRGMSYMALHDFRAAEDDFEKAISLGLKTPEIYVNLGDAYFKNRLYDSAIQASRTALSLDSSMSVAWYNLILTLYTKENYEEVIAPGNHFRTQFPKDSFIAPVLYFIGDSYLQMDGADSAAAVFLHYISVKPIDADGYVKYGASLAEAGKYEEALLATQRARRADSSYAEIYKLRYMIFNDLEMNDSAELDSLNYLKFSK